ncbi:MAG: RnfH family protein [Burkholderiaceae bacterium]
MLTVLLVRAPGPRQIERRELWLPAGTTLGQALAAAGWSAEAGDEAGIWGRRAPLGQALRDGDRVELYRPLKVDPKRARRERFGQQGARTAGLFARRRPGAKPGY